MSSIAQAQLARSARRARADVLANVDRMTAQEIHDLIAEPHPCLASMFCFDALRALPGIGPSAVREINRNAIRLQVNLAATLGELTAPRRAWVAAQALRRINVDSRRPQG